MRILLTGQCTLHWGRMEFGNIGNYYIIEPFIRELHKTFPGVEIFTTFQMSDRFCSDEKVTVLPMDLYYSWDIDNLDLALKELGSALFYSKSKVIPVKTPYIEQVLASDLLIDFSGDIWGDNADFLGKDRFLVGLIKDRVSQLLGKKTVLLAGSPGPFNNENTIDFAKEVFKNFDLVTNRESISINLLNEYGFETAKVKNLACPAFLFEPAKLDTISELLEELKIKNRKEKIVGFILCGWNFLEGPFDKKHREDDEFNVFAEAVEFINNELGAKVILISHSNGFPIPPLAFELQHGRDYTIIKQLDRVLKKRQIANNFTTVDNVLDAWQTKALIGQFDMLVSGRIHGAVAGLSQNVPTVIIDYGHEPKAHKLKGFAIEAGVVDYVADPNILNDLITKIHDCWKNRTEIHEALSRQIPKVKEKARNNFKELKGIMKVNS